jgi:hypothetical protein
MEIKITTRHLLIVLAVISWIIFLGLCIQACGLIFNGYITLSVTPEAAQKFWREVDLSALYKYDRVYFIILISYMSLVTILKAWMFYLIIAILQNKKFNFAQPFNNDVKKFISRVATLALFIGVLSSQGGKVTDFLLTQGVELPDVRQLEIAGADVWLFMAVILFVIAQIFKRGIEIQTENDLTV